nr:hypothetical protein BSM_20180 [uncultured archaeon]
MPFLSTTNTVRNLTWKLEKEKKRLRECVIR